MTAKGQASIALASRCEDRISDSGQNGDWSDFPGSSQQSCIAIQVVDFDGGHLGHVEQLIIVKITLLHAAFIKGDFRLDSVREAKSYSALQRIGRYARIEHGSGVGYDDNAMNLDKSRLVNGQLDDVTGDGSEGFREGDATMVT